MIVQFFKISPDETLAVVQELYEKKLVTYPRTDARVLSTAVAKEIHKNIRGLLGIPGVRDFAQQILDKEMYKGLEKTRYVNDKQITDHYAIIPTGQGLSALKGLSGGGGGGCVWVGGGGGGVLWGGGGGGGGGVGGGGGGGGLRNTKS